MEARLVLILIFANHPRQYNVLQKRIRDTEPFCPWNGVKSQFSAFLAHPVEKILAAVIWIFGKLPNSHVCTIHI